MRLLTGHSISGLRWKDINLNEKILSVRRQSTKTNAGARVIPLNKDALAILNELQERAINLNCSGQDDYIFPACENGRIDPSQPMKGWRTAWRSLTRKAGLQGLRFHDLRHQAVTELAEKGHSDQTIMSIAGHVSQAMLNHYSHIRIVAKRRALESLESLNSDLTSTPGNVSSTPANTPMNATN
jgi:integrase